MITPPSGTRGEPGCATSPRSPISRCALARTGSRTWTWRGISAAWLTAPGSLWPRWMSSSSTVASRRTSSTSAAAPIAAAFGIILEDPSLKGILVNVFGGIIRCDMVARSIIEASEEKGLNVPLVVRFSGTNHKEGKEILDACDLETTTTSTLAEAGEAIVKVIGGGSS